MSTKKGKAEVAEAVVNVLNINTTFKSGAEIGYAAAKSADAQWNCASAMAERYGAHWFDDGSMSDDAIAEVKSGMVTRKAEITPVTYWRETERDTFEEITSQEYDAKNDAHLALSVGFCMAFSQQAFGALSNKANNRPNYKRLIKGVRDDVSNYVAARWSALKRAGKAQVERTRTKASPHAFKDTIVETMATLRKKNKVARDQRKDETAVPDGVLDLAIRAFYKVVNDHYLTLKAKDAPAS